MILGSMQPSVTNAMMLSTCDVIAPFGCFQCISHLLILMAPVTRHDPVKRFKPRLPVCGK